MALAAFCSQAHIEGTDQHNAAVDMLLQKLKSTK